MEAGRGAADRIGGRTEVAKGTCEYTGGAGTGLDCAVGATGVTNGGIGCIGVIYDEPMLTTSSLEDKSVEINYC